MYAGNSRLPELLVTYRGNVLHAASAPTQADTQRPATQRWQTASKSFLLHHPFCVIVFPFVQMSQTFQKQAKLLWYEIFDIVKQNCTTKFDGTPQDDLMEQLLSSRK